MRQSPAPGDAGPSAAQGKLWRDGPEQSRAALRAAIWRRVHTSAEEQTMPLAASSSYPALSVFWTIVEVFLWILWFWILIMVLIDLFRSSDLSGIQKAVWFVFVLFIPMIGVLAYLIVRGGSMHERSRQQARRQDEEFRSYVQEASGPKSAADELTKLAGLRDHGVITAEEFEREKSKLLNV
jgi:hypothetical protein